MDRTHLHLHPIPSLSPLTTDGTITYIQGRVTLIWPYSSTSRSTSILLTSPDPRQREKKGQVRIIFQGSSARAVTRTSLIAGDQLAIRLLGVQWLPAKDDDTGGVQTPGQGLEWTLVFGQRIVLEVSEAREILDWKDAIEADK